MTVVIAKHPLAPELRPNRWQLRAAVAFIDHHFGGRWILWPPPRFGDRCPLEHKGRGFHLRFFVTPEGYIALPTVPPVEWVRVTYPEDPFDTIGETQHV